MGKIFTDDQHDEFGSWALAYSPYGGADFGEIAAVAGAIGAGGDDAFYEAWISAGKRLSGEAEAALARGHKSSARELFLRASCFYGLSYHPLYGEPIDPRLTTAFKAQIFNFERGLALLSPPVEPLRIPFEGTSLPGYLIPAVGQETEVRPLLILTNGYDSTVTDMFFASAVAASRRGYHCLIFDGPGQGELLILHGLPLRADWEAVVKSVVDFALTLPGVDPARLALSGWSLGGYLALRAASAEHRLAACIADPGLLGLAPGFRKSVQNFGVSADSAAHLGDLDNEVLEKFSDLIAKDRTLKWKIVQRGYWVHGAQNLGDFLKAVEPYTLEGRMGSIQCPTLLTMAEKDALSQSAPEVYEALRCPKELIRFTAIEGAGSHCEMQNRSLLNRRVLDWLDTTLYNKTS